MHMSLELKIPSAASSEKINNISHVVHCKNNVQLVVCEYSMKPRVDGQYVSQIINIECQ